MESTNVVSTNAIINNILVQMSEFIDQKDIEKAKMILFVNLANYALQENLTALCCQETVTYTVIENWFKELIIEGCTKGTIKSYQYEIKNFFIFSGLEIESVTEGKIKEYLAHGKLIKKWKDATYNSKVRVLRSFFKYAYREDYVKEDPMKRVKETKAEYRMGQTLTAEQRELIRCACKNEREVSIVDLLYSSGGRISEICQINRNDIDFANKRMIIYGKGRKEREIYFSAQTSVHLSNYLKNRTDDNEALFVGIKQPNNRLTTDGIRYILKRIQKRDNRLDGLKISPHTFRRTCGTDMINRGAPGEVVQKKLGHVNINTTLQCYAKLSMDTMRECERRYGAA